MAKILGKKSLNTKVDELLMMAKARGFRDESYLVNYLNRIKEADLISSFKTEDILYEVIRRVISRSDVNSSAYIELSKKIFDTIIYDPANVEQIYLFYKYLDKIFSDDNVLEYFSKNMDVFKTINTLFGNTNKYSYEFFVYFCDYIISSKNDADIVIKYAKESRRYYVQDAPYYHSLLLFAEHSLDKHGRDLEKYYDESIDRDMKCSGFYSISEDDIVENTRKLEKAQKGVEQCTSKINELDGKILTLSDQAEERLVEIVKEKTGEVRVILEGAKVELNSSIEKATGAVTTRQAAFISALDEREKRFNAMAQGSLETMKHYTAEISKRLDAHPELENSGIFSGNPLFDKSIPVDDRYATALARKDPNAFYNENFDLILKYLIMRVPVMLVGPSGSGKTYTADQLGAILGCRVHNFGFVADEFVTFKGYMDAGGNFVKTPFYNIYKYGGIAFFDEVDNSASKALIELNKITAGSGFQTYMFPNGEEIDPNPSFNILAASNTLGDGANPAYPTREVMDMSTVSRFVQIDHGFDPKVEEKILSKYKDIYQFCLAFRTELERRQNSDVITTKNMGQIKEMLEAGNMFNWQEIISRVFTKHRSSTELKAIKEAIKDKVRTDTKIYTEFSKSVDNMSRVLTR